MQKNIANQKWVVFAFDETDNTAKTGDAANITANLRIDGGGANAVDDTNPTELEDGYYVFTITAAESNGNYILICPASSTGNIQVIGCPAAIWTDQAITAGAIEVTYTMYTDEDAETGPIEGVEIFITTDSAGNSVIWAGTTDVSGVLRESGSSKPWLDAGTYYFWRKKSGYTFTNPDTEVVA